AAFLFIASRRPRPNPAFSPFPTCLGRVLQTEGAAGSVWQMAAGRGGASRRLADSRSEAMVPDPRSTYKIGILSQRSECQFRLFIRNESAALANDLAHTIQKERRTLHHAAA